MMFDLMPFLRLVPNAITYGSALSACDSASQWQLALSLWLEANEATLEEIWRWEYLGFFGEPVVV